MSESDLYKEFRKEPIKENCIVFESLWGRSYSCNPAAMYEYISEHHPEYECIWFFNDPETPIPGNAKRVEKNSEEYYHYLATAKYFIYNANFPVSFVKRAGQVIVQTMHGTPFKTFGLDVEEELPTEKERMRVVNRSIIWDYLVAQGKFTKDMAWRWFRYDNTVLETGYPRTDSLFRSDEGKAEEMRKTLGLPAGKKVILYAPTWRDMERCDMMLDLELLRRELSDEYVLLIRNHYFVAEFYQIPEDGKFIFNAEKVDKIEDLFPVTDVLITDYSSVMFDFALTEKPMIFYTYDLEEYTRETRGAYFDIATEAPGTLAMTTEEVAEAVKRIEDHYKVNGSRIKGFRDKYLTYEAPGSAEKVYEEVFTKEPANNKAAKRNKFLYMARGHLSKKTYKNIRERMIRSMLNRP